MEFDHPEPDVTEPAAREAEPGGVTAEGAPSGQPDPAALVERLIEASEWPDPALLDQMVATGEAILDPLLAFMRTYPEDYEREIVLYNGIGILSMLRSPATIPDLVEIIKRYPEETGEFAARALGDLGAIGFEAALELLRDPSITGYPRQHAIEAARHAAGTDPALRARLADVVRPMLADALERTREEVRKYEAESAEEREDDDEEPEGWVLEDLDEEESYEDEDEDKGSLDEEEAGETSEETTSSSEEATSSSDIAGPDGEKGQPLMPHEELMFLIMDVAALADPQGRELIDAAFKEELVETFWVDEKSVERSYREGGEKSRPRLEWLEDYRRQYRQHMEYLSRPPTPPRPIYRPARPADAPTPSGEPPPLAPQVTIRNTGPKLGRNDPCWCGSGKKYKKCHLDRDASR